jgi:hypothetical protein
MHPSVPAALRLRDHSNLHADWSDAGRRLVPQVWPAFTPRFGIPAAGSVFTVGSCFARNIEEHVSRLGFRVPTLEFSVPEAERAGGRGNAVLNKYTPAAIRQEFEWTRRVLEAGGTVAPEHVAPLAFPCAGGQQIDLQLGGFRPVSPQRLLARRQALYEVFRHLFTADCVVLTLGLVEAWIDETTGLAIQQAPVQPAFRRSLQRFSFRRLDFASCRADVQAAIDTVRAVNPSATFLITTSPVPLDRTFTDDDVITATMYGKSVLRAVCGEIVAANERVDYFPSYESVMLTRDWSVFQSDRRHVSDVFVGKIVRRLLDTYFREAPIDRRMAHAAYMASLAGETADAGALRSLWEAAPQDVRAFMHYLKALSQTPDALAEAVGPYVDAAAPQQIVRMARIAKRDDEGSATVLGALAGAVAAAAGESAPAAVLSDLWTLWTQALMREERLAEAVDAVAQATRFWPADVELAELAAVASRRARRAGLFDPEPEAAAVSEAPTSTQALATAVDSGDPAAIASALTAARRDGADAEVILKIAQQTKRSGHDGIVSPLLAAVADALDAGPGDLDPAFAPLWRLWTQALMREDRLPAAAVVITSATRRWPDDQDLAAFSASVERRLRRAGLPDAVLVTFKPPPPEPTPAETLSAAVNRGTLPEVAEAIAKALDAGLGAAAVVGIAQQAKRTGQDSIVSPRLAVLTDALTARAGDSGVSLDPAFLPLWRLLSQALWRESHRPEALATAAAAVALWPDSEDALDHLDAMKRKVRKKGQEPAPGKPAAPPDQDAA